MKTILRTCFILAILLTGSLKVFSLAPEENRLRDSIFSVAANQPDDSLRSRYLRNMFQRNLGKPWPTELLDSALVIAGRAAVHSEELAACYDYFRHYQFHGDVKNMESRLKILKDLCFRYKDYYCYFKSWNIMLQSKSALGNTEFVIMEAGRMKKEANRLEYKYGIYQAEITLAQANYFSGKSDDAVTIYKRILEYPHLKASEKILIHGQLGNIYQGKNDFKQAINELKQQKDIIDLVVREDPENFYLHKNHYLEIELSYCRIYMETGDKEKLKAHLDLAGKYYSDDCFFSYFISYHTHWGGYYYMTHDWEACFKEFDIALAHFQGKQPLYENFVRRMKAQTVLASGRTKEAAEIYRTIALKGDSLNREVLRQHEAVHQANYKIRKALLDKEESEKHYRLIAVAAAAVTLIVLVIAIIHIFRIQQKLRRSEQQVRNALATVTAADKMKELFLQNVTYEIRIPLNAVVGLSDLMSSEKNLSPEDIQEYSQIIKNNSGKLLLLINNVLDLSRLEAGMMRFNLQKCDAVQLCREAKMMVEMQEGNPIRLTFRTDLESLSIQADSRWFLKLLTSVLSAPNGYRKPCDVEYTLVREGKNLKIVIHGSPLYKWTEDIQEQRIQHDINQLYLASFKGSYSLQKEGEEKTIVITYPLPG